MVEERKILIRFRPKRVDEAMLLQDYDARCEQLGQADHEYLRTLLLIGHAVMRMASPDFVASFNNILASKTNESNNTAKEHKQDSSTNESKASELPVQIDLNAQVKGAGPMEIAGSAVRNMAAILGHKPAS